jgi:hypothetical protein
MNDVVALMAVAGPLLLLAAGIALLLAVGPNDWSLLLPRWEGSWPHGVQEEEPHPWDFHGMRSGEAATRDGASAGGGLSGPPPATCSAGASGAAVAAGAPDADGPPAPSPSSRQVRDDLPIRLLPVRASRPGPWRPRRT